MTANMNTARILVLKAQDPTATPAEKHAAFGALVRVFQDLAFASAYAVLGDFQLAEDVAQEAFLSAWRNLPQLRQPDAFPGWLRRIVRTECSRATRRKRLRTTALEDGVDIPSGSADPQTAFERIDMMQTVCAAIDDLPEKERVVVILFYLEERSQQDIGRLLEVPTTTVAKRLYSARARLRDGVLNEFGDRFVARCPSRDELFAARVKAGIYDEYVGQYAFVERPDLVVTIRREGDKLVSEGAGQTHHLFALATSAHELFAKEFDGRGEFRRGADGQITDFVYYEFGREMGRARKTS